jgi:toxin ParE1/3/4
MKILWSPTAVADLAAIRSFIGQDQPVAANRIAERIQSSIQRLKVFPLSGREGREPGTREFAIPGTPYLAVYVGTGDEVWIATVLHGRQQWPKKESS